MNSALLEIEAADLVRELCSHPSELPWLEFKVNNDSPEAIGELFPTRLRLKAGLMDMLSGE
jgi:hypothetical protein